MKRTALLRFPLVLLLGTSIPASGQLPDTEWTQHGEDAGEKRYSALDQLTPENVAGLEVAWSYRIPKMGARLEATPIVVDGRMFVSGPRSTLVALDARTGEELWFWDPGIADEEAGGPSRCCGDVNRGVAVHDDKVIIGLLDGRLVALEQETGRIDWSVQTTPPGSDYSITGAPRVFRGRVIIGNGGAEYGVRGYVTAYDADNGEQLWRTYTVPGDPDQGFESDAMARAAETWSGEWWIAGGGGTVWDAIVYDDELNLVYIGTGNGAPWNRDHRSPDGGDNLYLSSIVALDGDTGFIRWYYQSTPGDDWDYTATQPLMLLDLPIDGTVRRTIVQAPKNGFFYVVDRVTGEFISAEQFSDDVTWATGVDQQTGRPIEAPGARYGMTGRPIWIAPGPTGAHTWPPMAWNEATGLVYLPAKNTNFFFEMASGFDYQAGRWNTGTVFRSANRPERPELNGPPTMLVAWDPVRQREVWRSTGLGENGGALSTAGGLVFWGTGSKLVAFEAATGRELWSGEVGRGTASPVTWSLDGVQYVTIAGGRGVSATAQDPPTIYTFALPGQR